MRGESWVESAQQSSLGRHLAALPFCVFRTQDLAARVGVGIGDQILDLHLCARLDLLHSLRQELIAACRAPVLNSILACGAADLLALRTRLMGLLGSDLHRETTQRALVSLQRATLLRPVDVPNFSDFYSSREHAENVGRLFRPESPLLPNYMHVPIAYHGRASSLVVSGTPVVRPWGQMRAASGDSPVFTPTAQLDYEMEIGAYLYGGNALGTPVPLRGAAEQIFGLTLLNDWSARDIQSWEYQPLGPFLGKSFATSVGAWVMPWVALAPYRVPTRARSADEPKPLPYLREAPGEHDGIDVTVEVSLLTARMREQGAAPLPLGRGNTASLFWSLPQMIAHHTSNGCNLFPGDLVATGTISGTAAGEHGCLLESTRRGAEPLTLPSGEQRSFLDDGDEVILHAFAERSDLPRLSFGECRGIILPSHPYAG